MLVVRKALRCGARRLDRTHLFTHVVCGRVCAHVSQLMFWLAVPPVCCPGGALLQVSRVPAAGRAVLVAVAVPYLISRK